MKVLPGHWIKSDDMIIEKSFKDVSPTIIGSVIVLALTGLVYGLNKATGNSLEPIQPYIYTTIVVATICWWRCSAKIENLKLQISVLNERLSVYKEADNTVKMLVEIKDSNASTDD